MTDTKSASKQKIPLVLKHGGHVIGQPSSAQTEPMGNQVRPLLDLRQTKNSGELTDKNVVIEVLSQLLVQTEKQIQQTRGKEREAHEYRLKSFKKAIASLKKYPKNITSGSEAAELEGIGKGIASRIDEILATGTLKELEKVVPVSNDMQVMNDLATISGIGEVSAQKYADMGVTSVADLKNKVKKGVVQVTHHVQVGLTYYDDIKQKIPHEEISQLSDTFKTIVLQVYPDLLIEVCGSYRRKKAFSGDIDILMAHHSIQTEEDLITSDIHYLQDVITALTKSGFLVGHLTHQGDTKYMGVCMHPDKRVGHRIDIRFVPYESYHTARLHFTGSYQLNIQMRNIALSQGYRLSEWGLFLLNGKHGDKGKRVPIASEADVFSILGIRFLEPEEREIN